MELYIIQYLGKEPPDDFTNVFFKPTIAWYFKYVATFIINGSEYRVEGPDEEIKRSILAEIARNNGQLIVDGSMMQDDISYQTYEFIQIREDEPKLWGGVKNLLPPGYDVVKGLGSNFLPVKNAREAQVLRERYLEEKARRVGR